MIYHSLSNPAHKVSFREAVIRSLAPDRGLYYPVQIPSFSREFWDSLSTKTLEELACRIMQPLVGEDITPSELERIVGHTLSFEFPLVPVGPHYALELFHGPTLAFKDVGARFMAQCLALFTEPAERKTVLVATSGDTGGAVAAGFLGVPGVQVVILYPKGRVSALQERQLTTSGQNISALEVAGTFDDCQAWVKQAFLDKDLQTCGLTSANSINVARWLPQMFYYISAVRHLQTITDQPLVFSVPSGNFGNMAAGLLAQRMGLPVAHMIAATNANATVPRYLESGQYAPWPTQSTLSNAMDVSDPSNFVRIRALMGQKLSVLRQKLTAYSFSDTQTRWAMQALYREGYLADPHGAVAWLGLQAFLEKEQDSYCGVFLETAHPVKFSPEVQQILGQEPEAPERVKGVFSLPMQKETIATYAQLKERLLEL
jgi:threonine synthase